MSERHGWGRQGIIKGKKLTFGITRKVQSRTENGGARTAHETDEAKKITERV